MIEIYWKFIGLPSSQIIGTFVDFIPWAVSESLLQLSILGIFAFLLSYKLKFFKKFRRFGCLSIICLITMFFSQGITSIDWVPTAHRLRPSTIIFENFKNHFDPYVLIKHEIKKIQYSFPNEIYRKITSTPNFDELDSDIKKALNYLNYPKGRKVKSIKKLWGLTRVLGLAYGGPAYHDVITGEVVIVSEEDYPTSKYWRIKCILHEMIHAQGFTREMDTEILTWLSLKLSSNKLFNSFASLMLLEKSNVKFQYPLAIQDEVKEVRQKRIKVQKTQIFINYLRNLMEENEIYNAAEKYGKVTLKQPLNENHEFFKSIALLSKHLAKQ